MTVTEEQTTKGYEAAAQRNTEEQRQLQTNREEIKQFFNSEQPNQ